MVSPAFYFLMANGYNKTMKPFTKLKGDTDLIHFYWEGKKLGCKMKSTIFQIFITSSLWYVPTISPHFFKKLLKCQVDSFCRGRERQIWKVQQSSPEFPMSSFEVACLFLTSQVLPSLHMMGNRIISDFSPYSWHGRTTFSALLQNNRQSLFNEWHKLKWFGQPGVLLTEDEAVLLRQEILAMLTS